ncbi:D-cysteine desulfhydrase family protein [Agrobacterium tumefaciens]|uniref:D-cysteine desulfhydrase family protein n=1 Tax=Agrobacterium tumefaciens TaxID=358 RepID=UPI00287F05D8|nr:D-cysteine desulfhydrase family protein [Agrobacterium tumefaciens]MDS7595446.1 D-cysteine desulfhydrase family protein [Agrobacterium tumefaciens]
MTTFLMGNTSATSEALKRRQQQSFLFRIPSVTVLADYRRVPLLDGPTPIQRLSRLETAFAGKLRGSRLWAKRDDFMSLGGGGNKLRKLEYLIGQALAEGCDTFVATGGLQSNFARLAAAACAKIGLDCDLVLSQMVPNRSTEYQNNGNVLLDRLLGARLHVLSNPQNSTNYVEALCEKLIADGKKPLVATLGGSTSVGCLGYVSCAFEIAEQEREMGREFSQIVIPNGSGGTHAGLVAGYTLAGRDPKTIRAYSVLAQTELAIEGTKSKANEVLGMLNSSPLSSEDVLIDGTQLGDGYGLPTSSMKQAIKLLARAEGIFVDPVYGGKALAGLVEDLDDGEVPENSDILFLMTGGGPGLFAYADALAL